MKAVFKKTVLDKLMEIRSKAERDRKEVDYVILTSQEYAELLSSQYVHHYLEYQFQCNWADTASPARSFRKVDLELDYRRHSVGCPRYLSLIIRDEKVFGMSLLVVPTGYEYLAVN
jgi:hypothetical protein